MSDREPKINPCQKPTGWLGWFVLHVMNARHSGVTDWGLSQISVGKRDVILDVGCGGGRTVSKLAALAQQGKVYGVDYARESVKVATKVNRDWIKAGSVEIREASVSELPFPDNSFDLITAVETHFWWPDLPVAMHELLRVLKQDGNLVIIAEIYRGANSKTVRLAEKHLQQSGMKLLTADQHRELFTNAGYSDVEVNVDAARGWICATGRKRRKPGNG